MHFYFIWKKKNVFCHTLIKFAYDEPEITKGHKFDSFRFNFRMLLVTCSLMIPIWTQWGRTQGIAVLPVNRSVCLRVNIGDRKLREWIQQTTVVYASESRLNDTLSSHDEILWILKMLRNIAASRWSRRLSDSSRMISRHSWGTSIPLAHWYGGNFQVWNQSRGKYVKIQLCKKVARNLHRILEITIAFSSSHREFFSSSLLLLFFFQSIVP